MLRATLPGTCFRIALRVIRRGQENNRREQKK
jgi:hypothetical protein